MIKKSTLSQYNSSFKKWFTFCDESAIDPFRPTETELLSFLAKYFHERASYGTLNAHRSAVSHISKNKIGDNVLINRFLKACFNIRPTQSKCTLTWDVNIVLEFYDKLGENRNMSFKNLSLKCVVLFALCTAQRLHTMSRTKLENVHYLSDKVIIRITEITKTSAREKPSLSLKYRRNVCLYECLSNYVRASARAVDHVIF